MIKTRSLKSHELSGEGQLIFFSSFFGRLNQHWAMCSASRWGHWRSWNTQPLMCQRGAPPCGDSSAVDGPGLTLVRLASVTGLPGMRGNRDVSGIRVRLFAHQSRSLSTHPLSIFHPGPWEPDIFLHRPRHHQTNYSNINVIISPQGT